MSFQGRRLYLLEQFHNTGDKMYLKTLKNTLGDFSSHTNCHISDTVHLYQPTISHQTSLCFLLLAPPITDNQSRLGRAAFCCRLPQTPQTNFHFHLTNTPRSLCRSNSRWSSWAKDWRHRLLVAALIGRLRRRLHSHEEKLQRRVFPMGSRH